MFTKVTIRSFGYLHGVPAGDALLVDLRDRLYNPHEDPAMRELTGLDDTVSDRVMFTPEAGTIVRGIVAKVRALLADPATMDGWMVNIHIGCQGGRHRSVAVAAAVAEILRGDRQYGVDVEHLHIDRPVVTR